MASRVRTRFRCSECGATAPRWSGRCAGCGAWNTSVEEPAVRAGVAAPVSARDAVVHRLGELVATEATPEPTGVDEFDRVLAGGLVPGSVTLLSGPPGVGKSTLALQVAARCAGAGPVLYVAAEETAAQIRRRAIRLGVPDADRLAVTAEADLDRIEAAVADLEPGVVIVDSIQTVADPALGAAPGSVTQVRGCAQRLAERARSEAAAVVLVGHVTKDGQIAGPRLLEHLVDTVVTLDAEADGSLRFLRATKHRFGPVGELGVFRMRTEGMVGVPDAAGLFLEDRPTGVPGSVVVPTLDGRRVMVTEVQALVGEPDEPVTVRLAQGVSRNRLELVVAVLARRAGLRGGVFCSLAGGAQMTEPGGDLGVAVAVLSAFLGVPVRADTVVFGELGLVGEVRRVRAATERLAQAARLGFTRAVVPAGGMPGACPGRIEVVEVSDLAGAVDAALGAATALSAHRAAGGSPRPGPAATAAGHARPTLVT